ncbi:MAG: hypothetical protein MI739_11550 [Bacteroidales bacterium]|nr:hypothetical protein [Bacteroidales bacterium]
MGNTNSKNVFLSYLRKQQEQQVKKEEFNKLKEDIGELREQIATLQNNKLKEDIGLLRRQIASLQNGKKPDGSKFSLDEIENGVNFKKVKSGAVTDSGQINLRSAHVINKLFTVAQSDYLKAGGVQLINNDWSLGSGATDFFNCEGYSSESHRVLGVNPYGEKSILWECRPDVSNNADGGWNTTYFEIDKTKTYRFSVFIKTSNTTGHSYLGCGKNTVCILNTTEKHPNPYFWHGDLPSNNTWYLIVGYVFPAGETGLSTQGGIYNCNTGKKVANISRSFNWASDAVDSCHRSYHYYDDNATTRQWMYHPRVDLVNGSEPSILSLLGKVTPVSIGAKSASWKPSTSDLPTIPQSKIQSLTAQLNQINNRLNFLERNMNGGGWGLKPDPSSFIPR